MANTDPQKIGLLRLHMAGGDPLPPSLLIYPIRVAHGYIAAALAALIGLHFVAAPYHQFFSATGFFDGCGLGGERRFHDDGPVVPAPALAATSEEFESASEESDSTPRP